MHMKLGLDASTTTIGYGVVDDKNNIIDIGFFEIDKIKKHKDKSYAFINFIKNKSWFKSIKSVTIEAALDSFTRGKSSKHTIILLHRWNAVFSYIIEEELGIEPTLASASAMRMQLFNKCRIKGIDPKAFVKSHIESKYDLSKWIVYSNKKGRVHSKMADAYDGLVTAFYKI